jgi:hypothetical protein
LQAIRVDRAEVAGSLRPTARGTLSVATELSVGWREEGVSAQLREKEA